MDIYLHYFAVLDISGQPKLIINKSDEIPDIRNDQVFQTAVARVGQNLQNKSMAISYNGIDHYISLKDGSIILLGFDQNSSTRPYIKYACREIFSEDHFPDILQESAEIGDAEIMTYLSLYNELYSILVERLRSQFDDGKVSYSVGGIEYQEIITNFT